MHATREYIFSRKEFQELGQRIYNDIQQALARVPHHSFNIYSNASERDVASW